MRIRFLTLIFLSISMVSAYADGEDSLGVLEQESLVKIKPVDYKRNNRLLSPSGINGADAVKYKRWTGLKYSGYARSFLQYRNMPTRYADVATRELLTVNGLDIATDGVYTGYQEPLFLIRVEGNPTARTWFQVEYAMDNQMMGLIRQDNTLGQNGTASNLNNRLSVYRILQFKAGTTTKIGDFNLIAGGGVNWYKMSPFTLWNYEYRDDMFERYPWDPDQMAWNKYNVFYSSQNIARDSRWGNTATQGFVIEGKNLPKGFGFAFLYGKTDNSGGFGTYNTKIPKNLLAFRVKKGVGAHELGFNFFEQLGFTDGTAFNRIRQQIITTDGRINLGSVKVFYEVGMGQWQDGIVDKRAFDFLYSDVDLSNDSLVQLFEDQNGLVKAGDDYMYKSGRDFGWHKGNNAWKNNRAISLQFDFSKEATFIPFSLQLFSIGKGVVNVNSQILNSANDHAIGNPANVATGQKYDLSTLPGAVTDIGQMTNNRQGLYLKHENSYGKLKVMLAYGLSQEIENDTANAPNMISYWHQANPFTRSRFTYFQSQTGPYGRVTSMFRRTYEKFTITDPDSLIDYKKSYNTISGSLKYKLNNVFGKELILAVLANYNSVSDKISVTPTFSDKAFLRTTYVEFNPFYNIHPKVTLLGTIGFEWVKGNNRINLADDSLGTEIRSGGVPVYDPKGKTVDQIGHGYGIGVDYNFSSKAGLYVRNRWFDHKDKNFKQDVFKGMETTIELKIFF